MAREDLVQDPEEITEEERRRRIALGAIAPVVPPVPNNATDAFNAPVPEITGLKPIAPPANLATAERLPTLGYQERKELPLSSPGTMPASSGYFENKLARVQDEAAHPWGTPENHPGTLGRIGHTLGKIGNVALDVAGISSIPGTDPYRRAQEQTLEGDIERSRQAEGQERLHNVQEKNLESEIEARQNPKPRLLPGEENIATDAQGNRYQRYELGDQSTVWSPEGQAPQGLRPIAAPSSPSGGLAPIAPSTPAATTDRANALPGAAGLPAGATVGKPKTASDEEKFTTEYLKDNKLEDTAENRAKARASFTSGGPIGADQAAQLSTQIANVLKGTGIDTTGYAVNEKSTRGEAQEALKAAQTAAAQARAERSAERAAKTAADKGPQGNMYSATVNGREVAGTLAQMKALGVKEEDLGKVSTENASKIENARVLSQWINSKDPEDPGVIAIAQKLEKEGKLGPIMSRYQDFINKTGSVLGFDSGDPDFQRLMTGMGLETTALMQVHVGSRGGAALLDHFHDLADAKQLSGPAFLAALDYENKYIQRKAMLPQTSAGGGGQAGQGHSFTINGVPYHNVSDEDYKRAQQIKGFKE